MLSSIFKSFDSLSLVMKFVEKTYPFPNIDSTELFEKLNYSSSDILLYDTRQSAEFEMSHIKDAIFIDTQMQADEFLEAHEKNFENKILVFYCSVGQRSSQFISSVHDLCLDKGAGGLYNLRGGIFKWYNDGYPVYNNESKTNAIHPYNEFWGNFVEPRQIK